MQQCCPFPTLTRLDAKVWVSVFWPFTQRSKSQVWRRLSIGFIRNNEIDFDIVCNDEEDGSVVWFDGQTPHLMVNLMVKTLLSYGERCSFIPLVLCTHLITHTYIIVHPTTNSSTHLPSPAFSPPPNQAKKWHIIENQWHMHMWCHIDRNNIPNLMCRGRSAVMDQTHRLI